MKNLKEARLNKRVTQQEMADTLGVSRVTYARYEAGTYEPDIATSIKLADILECSIDFLVGRQDSDQQNIPTPSTIAAHTVAPMTPELEKRIQEIVAETFERLTKNQDK